MKSKFETRWVGLAFTTEKMIRGKRTSPETGVGSFKRRDTCSCGFSRSRGGGTDLVFGPTTEKSLPPGSEVLSPVVDRKVVSGELLVTAGGSGSRLVLLLRTDMFAAVGFAVKGTSLTLSCDLTSSSEISRTGGNLASPSFGEAFRKEPKTEMRFTLTYYNFMGSNKNRSFICRTSTGIQLTKHYNG